MAEASDGVTEARLLLVEYERIKDEQNRRIGFRDNLIYANLAALALVVAASIQGSGRVSLLLVAPLASVVLGWTYVANDEKISAIGRYIRCDLAPRLAEIIGNGSTVFGWEAVHRVDRRFRSRKLLQLAVDLLTFCVPPVAAIAAYCLSGRWQGAVLPLLIFELGAVGVLAAQIVAYAKLRP